jgi:hypothetical protein
MPNNAVCFISPGREGKPGLQPWRRAGRQLRLLLCSEWGAVKSLTLPERDGIAGDENDEFFGPESVPGVSQTPQVSEIFGTERP